MNEINEFLHTTLPKNSLVQDWKLLEKDERAEDAHPLAVVAFKAYNQIKELAASGKDGATEEIFELFELADKCNKLNRFSVDGFQERLSAMVSRDFAQYKTARYEIQIAGMLLSKGHKIAFIQAGSTKTPDILVENESQYCEFECKHKDPAADQLDYIQSIYNNTQRARKQFSKTCAGVIAIDIDKVRFEDFQKENKRLEEEINRVMRNSMSISAILLTSKIAFDDDKDYVYRHRVRGYINSKANFSIPEQIFKNLIYTDK